MAATNKAIIAKLLREGTSAGPVTQTMIDWCFARDAECCKKENKKTLGPYSWMDWLAQARGKFRSGKDADNAQRRR